MMKLPDPTNQPAKVLLDKKTWRGIQPGIALPHQGMQERLRRMLKDKKQWLWMVQFPFPEKERLEDTGQVVATAEKHRHQFTRRLTKKEVIAHITQVWKDEQAKSKQTNLTNESTKQP